jgi:hypothetical protein
MKLDLTDEEREALLRVIEAAIQASRFPLSPETEALKRVADKLREDDNHRAPRR